ncbi:TPA: ParA family protein [Vibrio vulnificus]|nr:ParA family protein [Vibrio vulnificus]
MKRSIVIANGKGGTGKSTDAFNISSGTENSVMLNYDITANFAKTLNAIRKENAEKLGVTPVFAPIFESFEHIQDDESSAKSISMIKETLQPILDDDEVNAVFDLGGYDTQYHRLFYSIADVIIFPVNSSILDLSSLELMNNILKDVSKEENRKIVAKVLPCRLHHNVSPNGTKVQKIAKAIEQYEHIELLEGIVIHQLSMYEESLEKGLSILEDKRFNTSQEADVIRELITKLELPLKQL